jgi:hypothetical protein
MVLNLTEHPRATSLDSTVSGGSFDGVSSFYSTSLAQFQVTATGSG